MSDHAVDNERMRARYESADETNAAQILAGYRSTDLLPDPLSLI